MKTKIKNIHFSIEAKNRFTHLLKLDFNNNSDFTRFDIYFLMINFFEINPNEKLPYIVQKLSKKARRNKIN